MTMPPGYRPRLSLSYGAPVPDDPRRNFRPSSEVTSRPLARFQRSLAWYPVHDDDLPDLDRVLLEAAPQQAVERAALDHRDLLVAAGGGCFEIGPSVWIDPLHEHDRSLQHEWPIRIELRSESMVRKNRHGTGDDERRRAERQHRNPETAEISCSCHLPISPHRMSGELVVSARAKNVGLENPRTAQNPAERVVRFVASVLVHAILRRGPDVRPVPWLGSNDGVFQGDLAKQGLVVDA